MNNFMYFLCLQYYKFIVHTLTFVINFMHFFLTISDADVSTQLSCQTTYQLTSLLCRHLRSNPLKRASLYFLLDLCKRTPNITYLLKIEYISKNAATKIFGRCKIKYPFVSIIIQFLLID